MNVDYPYHFDFRGLTGEATTDDHIRDLIHQVLFTAPGERVNRPDFGAGLLQLTFEPNSDELASATRFLIQSALQRWLSDRISVENVLVENRDAAFHVTVEYILLRTQLQQEVTYKLNGGAT